MPDSTFSFWREELKRAWSELRGPETTPGRAAFSVALGLFIGSLPIFGCHTPLIVGLCIWFQLDAAVAWVVSNVSNPFFAPALLTAEVQIGAWVRTGAPLRLHQELTHGRALRHFIGYMFLGAPIAGLMLALCGGAVTYGLATLLPRPIARERYRLPPNAPDWMRAVERVAARFASPRSPSPGERTHFHYVRAKLLGDPVAKLVARIAGTEPNALGTLYDVGTGRGQLPLLLMELGCSRRARGVDWDGAKIAAARHAAAQADGEHGCLDASFTRGDLRIVPFEPADTVLLIDVLHYFTQKEQDAILDRAAAAVRPNGRILVRDADTSRGWRSFLTLVEERMSTLLRFNRGERVHFRSAQEIAAHLAAAGFRCTIHPAWGKTPFSNVLVVGKRQ